jgi:hypothetical protein
VTLRARWVTLRARWVTLRAPWVNAKSLLGDVKSLLGDVQVCFSSRADEYNFTGVWSPGPAEGDSWDSCEHPAVIIKHHLCDARHPEHQKLHRLLDDR